MLKLEITYIDDKGRNYPIAETSHLDVISAVASIIADNMREIANRENDPVFATLFYSEIKRIKDLVEAAGGAIPLDESY